MSDSMTRSVVRNAAIYLLAMREHSSKEIFEKLGRKFPNTELITDVVASLAEQDLQSDARFAEEFVRMRQRQGKGTLLIKMELRERGVAAEIIDRLLDDKEGIWFELAREVRVKRFKSLPKDGREKAKQIRFLQSRGFAARHIQSAFVEGDLDY